MFKCSAWLNSAAQEAVGSRKTTDFGMWLIQSSNPTLHTLSFQIHTLEADERLTNWPWIVLNIGSCLI